MLRHRPPRLPAPRGCTLYWETARGQVLVVQSPHPLTHAPPVYRLRWRRGVGPAGQRPGSWMPGPVAGPLARLYAAVTRYWARGAAVRAQEAAPRPL